MPLDAVAAPGGRVAAAPVLSTRSRRALRLQRALGWLTAPAWLPLLMIHILLVMRWRIADLARFRREFRALRGNGPVLLCANHLTMVDSAVIAWALQPPVTYLLRFGQLPWNLPEWRNFADQRWKRVAVFLLKCVPIRRGGERDDVRESLNRISWLMQQGEPVLIFPEGGRSRSGRVNRDSPAHGVGRMLLEVPDARVICIYLRGSRQHSWSDWPARDETFHIALRELRPTVQGRGLRASRDLTNQILACLDGMEAEYFRRTGTGRQGDDRQ